MLMVQRVEHWENDMKLSDIKRFTRNPNYAVNVSWRELIRAIEHYQRDLGLQLDPDFQRAHVWNHQQRISYVEFRLRGGLTGRDVYLNHPGWQSTFKGDFVLVDGKQRLMAVTMFLNNVLPIFGGYFYKDFEDELHSLEPDFVFHVNDLKTRYEVLTWYLEFNTGGVVHTEVELNRVRQLLELEKQHV